MTADTQTRPTTSIGSLIAQILSARHDPAARILNFDLVAVLVAAMLPWSTSGVAIGMVLWLVALAPTMDWRSLLHLLRRPISLLPIVIVVLAVARTLWSYASLVARAYASIR